MNKPVEKEKYIIYCRKSSESEDRQMASIEDQISEMNKIASNLNIDVVEVLTESQSAKQPGRPIFNQMLEKIHRGEANGILCWKLNRLARNPIDGGQISWMLQQNIIKKIQTYSGDYKPSDNVLMMQVEFGMANQYVKDLSMDTKRGQRQKAERGWRPAPAPIGYMNVGEVGDKIIVPDPDRFEIVKRCFDLMVTGTYSVAKILDIANNEWGLRTFPRKKAGNKPLSRSNIYEMFRNPFYYGYFTWKDENGEYQLYKGKHQPMITKDEYDRIQLILGKKGNPRAKTREFSFTGLSKCGECGSSITAETKEQCICDCKNKFSTISRTDCPKCGLDISKMKNPKFLEYTYYYCTKKKGPCSQKYISIKDFEDEIDKELLKINIDDNYLNLAIEYLNERDENDIKTEKTINESLQKTFNEAQARLVRLNQEYTSTANKDYGIYSPEEFRNEKTLIKKEIESIKKQIGDCEDRVDKTLELSEKTFNFCAYARYNFDKGDLQVKRNILSALGPNITLKDKKLKIDLLYPYLAIEKYMSEQKLINVPSEHKNILTTKGKEAVSTTSCPGWLRRQDSNL